MASRLILRKLMQAKTDEKSDDNNEDYDTESVVVGTSTVIDNDAADDDDAETTTIISTTVMSNIDRGKEMINTVSHKLKGVYFHSYFKNITITFASSRIIMTVSMVNYNNIYIHNSKF